MLERETPTEAPVEEVETPEVNKQEDEEVVLDVIQLETEEPNPVKRPFEQSIKVEWTPAQLIQEKVFREIAIDKMEKEIAGIKTQIENQQRSLTHTNRIMALPEVKVLIDAEEAYIAAEAKKTRHEFLKESVRKMQNDVFAAENDIVDWRKAEEDKTVNTPEEMVQAVANAQEKFELANEALAKFENEQ